MSVEKAIQTTKEIITQRGYKITEIEDDKILGTRGTEKICIFTGIVSKFSIGRVKEYLSILETMNIKNCIVIYTDQVTPKAKKLIENAIDVIIELFTLCELQYNITKHKLVPQHVKLSPHESKKFKEHFGVKFPTLLKTDPVSRFYNFKRGDIIKIIRSNGYISYRIVKG